MSVYSAAGQTLSVVKEGLRGMECIRETNGHAGVPYMSAIYIVIFHLDYINEEWSTERYFSDYQRL